MRQPVAFIVFVSALLANPALTVAAKPIALATGTSVLAEYDGDAIRQAQVLYVRRFDLSVGAEYVRLTSALDDRQRDMCCLRIKFLPKRWSVGSAQANVFVWSCLGSAEVRKRRGSVFAQSVGAQFDNETGRIILSPKTDPQSPDAFSHRIDIVPLGIAPDAHDSNTLATSPLVQGRRYSGNVYEGLVAVARRDGQDIANDELIHALKKAGYDVKPIARTEQSISGIRARSARQP